MVAAKSGAASWQETPLGGGGSGSGSGSLASHNQRRIHFADDFSDHHILSSSSSSSSLPMSYNGPLDFMAAFEDSINRIERDYKLVADDDNLAKRLLLALSRRLIMLINSILGLSLSKLASFYLGPDICYILAGRFLCLLWLAVRGRPEVGPTNLPARSRSSWLSSLNKWLPVNKWTLIKLLLVLAYTQTLIQQIENRQHLLDWKQASQSLTEDGGQSMVASCCGATGTSSQDQQQQQQQQVASAATSDENDLKNWFNCMWTSAKACQHLSQAGKLGAGAGTGGNWSGRLMELLRDGLGQLSANFLLGLKYVHAFIHSAFGWFGLARMLWLARWRSPIVQRLLQSMLVQVYYIGNLLCSSDTDDADHHHPLLN